MEKMNISPVNQKFIEDYFHVISYHVDCILRSRMILDEDMNLILTFWDPSLIKRKPVWNKCTLIPSACATFGMLVSLKFHNTYPFALSCLPVAVQVSQSLKRKHKGNRYKKDFENLISFICELYELNRNIMEYCHKRNTAMQSNDAYMLLLKPGEIFLKSTILLEITILEKLKSTLLKVSELVPVTEGEYIYFTDWNFKEFAELKFDTFRELQHQFQKLSDLYVLVVSNFLSCLGLSFCFQLWKDATCNFKNIFDCIIPELNTILESSVNDIKAMFNNVRFTLHNKENETSRKQRNNLKNPKELLQLQKCLQDFLTNVQVVFETGNHLQVLIDECDDNSKLVNYTRTVEDINNQLIVCDDSLDTFLKQYYLLTKHSFKKEANSLPLSSLSNSDMKVIREIRYDDPMEPIEDEEYNLSIHGSDDDEIMPFMEYADQVSTEHLELMLHELKVKLKERKGIRDESDDNKKLHEKPSKSVGIKTTKKSQSEIFTEQPIEHHITPLPPPLSFASSNDVLLTPPPPPLVGDSTAISQLPPINHSQLAFLDAVKSVAQRLNRDEEFQFGFNMFPEIPRPFNTTYSCFSVAMLPGNERQDVESGGKIIMPPSALEQLTRLNINYPMLFKITNKKTNRITHCGVLEFVADEGKVYLPLWMMHNLVLEESDLIQIESVSLPVGKFAKFQPLSPDFLDITNPKAVLENCLRTFACLTSGDVIAVKYNQRVYELCVLETQPGNAISIIECDMNVEFAAPVGYKEAEVVKHQEEDMVVDPADLMPEPSGFVAFRGIGNRLDGKRRKDSGPSDSSSAKPVYIRGIPDYDYEIGTLRFLRHFAKSPENNKEENGEFKAFSGEGFSLKRRN